MIQIWWKAARPRTLPFVAAPFVVGTFLTPLSLYEINYALMLAAILCTFFLQVATNYLNDAIDGEAGADTSERIGPQRVTATGLIPAKVMYLGGYIAMTLAVAFAFPLIWEMGMPMVLVIAAALFFAAIYSGGPYPLTKIGFAEIVVFVFYGWVATLSAYALQTGMVDFKAWLGGAQIGSLACLPLELNYFRDVVQDQKAGRRTCVIRFGELFARRQMAFSAFLPFFLSVGWLYVDAPLAAAAPWLAFPLASQLVRNIYQHDPSPICNLFFNQGAKLPVIFALLLVLGYRLG